MNPTALACVTKIRVQSGGGGNSAAAVDNDDDGGGGGGGGGASAAAPRAKKTPGDTWIAQLQMIPRVSAMVAKAIAARYPTFRALMDAYADPGMSAADKARLLEVRRKRGQSSSFPMCHSLPPPPQIQDVRSDVVGAGKKATQLSANIYLFFTTTNKDEVIGAPK